VLQLFHAAADAHDVMNRVRGNFRMGVSDKIIFRNGKQAGSWSDLKVGQTVEVNYFHQQGKDRVADEVTIIKQ
jgi:hypothetical protein